MYDAIVVGLGPAGSTAAYYLASAGLSVLAVDKARFPRYKSCGGCVSAKIARVLDFDISATVEHTVSGICFTYKHSRPVDIISDKPIGFNVMRDSFDHFLVKKAEAVGAQIIQGLRVSALSDDHARVTVRCDDGRGLEAAFLIGADGASGVVGRDYFGFNPKESAVSITSEIPCEPSTLKRLDNKVIAEFGSIPFGYGWIFPKKESLSIGVAADTARIGRDIKKYFNEFVSRHELLKDLEIRGRDGWMVPTHYTDSPHTVKGRVLLAGDTGHLVDPFLGEGIYYAALTGKAAAQAVISCVRRGTSDLSNYQAWIEKELYPEFKAAGKLSDLVYTHPRLWYNILEKEPDIMRRFYDVIRGDESLDSYYTWVHASIKGKPLGLLRRWIESRFLPT
ncbi:MAG: geranylgeranyl reductase family protein [Deltaproteobacteria bacterium]|nr:geranylgeranyl reductase family protein [Deltaproteobacteria bacterium]